MNSSLMASLRSGLDFVEQFAPVATQLGIPFVETAVNIASGLLDVATNVKDRVEEGNLVLHSDDQAELNNIVAKLAKANDELAVAIAAS